MGLTVFVLTSFCMTTAVAFSKAALFSLPFVLSPPPPLTRLCVRCLGAFTNCFAALLLFRKHSIALTSDVEKMFRMIEVHESDRDYLHLLWRRPGSNEPLKTYRMTRLPFGLNCSPFLAIQTMLHHFSRMRETYPVSSLLLAKHMYVDDCLFSVENEHDAIQLRQNISKIAQAGGFRFVKWLSNNPRVMATINKEET
jgi:hypothetical protein